MRSVNSKAVYRSFFSAVKFFYENGPRFVLLSVVWFFSSLPLITLGPATLGAYAAILSLRKGYSFDIGYVATILRRHGLSAALLTGIPFSLAVVSVLYAREYLATPSTFLLVLVVGSAYAAIYTALVFVPTFISLANGTALEPAIRTGIRWTASNAIGVATMAMATLVVLIVTGLLTVAFVLVFGGFAFAFHLDVVLEPSTERDGDGDGLALYPSVADSS